MCFVSAAVEIERTDILAGSEFPRVLQARCVWEWWSSGLSVVDPPGEDPFFLVFSWVLGFVCCRVLISLLACLQRSIMARSQDLHKTLHASGSYLPFHLMPAHV